MLATYMDDKTYMDGKEDHSSAIIKCKYGKGVAILSGVHYEVNSDMLRSMAGTDDTIKPIAAKIDSTQRIKNDFLDKLF